MVQQVILVDNNNNQIGTALKSKVHTKNTPLHRGLSVFLFNRKGELLLQQRSHKKKTFPLVWSNSCCGHVLVGETVEKAVKRHLKHELGIEKADIHKILPDFRYTAVDQKGIKENELCPVFAAFSDEKPEPNPDEVENIKWIPWEYFVKETEQVPKNYSSWSVEETKLLKESNKFQGLFKRQTS